MLRIFFLLKKFALPFLRCRLIPQHEPVGITAALTFAALDVAVEDM